jgi:carbonic anhydrase
MLKKLLGGVFFAAAVSFAGEHGNAVRWGYSGPTGPQHWGDLSPKFIMCKIGKNQSPIDINDADTVKACVKPPEFHYMADALYVINNGHTIKVVTKGESYIVVDGRKFYLRQFHFHAPSEHTVNGVHYPFEVHFVHTDKYGNIAVVAVLFKEEDDDSDISLKTLWKYFPRKVGEKKTLPIKFNPASLLPENREAYRYDGSLTTPPCSEGVRWFVLKIPMVISEDIVRDFEGLMGGPNNRPVQPINARKVLK